MMKPGAEFFFNLAMFTSRTRLIRNNRDGLARLFVLLLYDYFLRNGLHIFVIFMCFYFSFFNPHLFCIYVLHLFCFCP